MYTHTHTHTHTNTPHILLAQRQQLTRRARIPASPGEHQILLFKFRSQAPSLRLHLGQSLACGPQLFVARTCLLIRAPRDFAAGLQLALHLGQACH